MNAEAATELGQEVLENLSYHQNSFKETSTKASNSYYGDLAKQAIKDGADLTIMDKDGFRAIDLALYSGDDDLIDDILESPTAKRFINLQNRMGHTPLQTAIHVAKKGYDYLDIITKIIKLGGVVTPAILDQAAETLGQRSRIVSLLRSKVNRVLPPAARPNDNRILPAAARSNRVFPAAAAAPGSNRVFPPAAGSNVNRILPPAPPSSAAYGAPSAPPPLPNNSAASVPPLSAAAALRRAAAARHPSYSGNPQKGGQRKQYTRKYSKKSRKYRK